MAYLEVFIIFWEWVMHFKMEPGRYKGPSSTEDTLLRRPSLSSGSLFSVHFVVALACIISIIQLNHPIMWYYPCHDPTSWVINIKVITVIIWKGHSVSWIIANNGATEFSRVYQNQKLISLRRSGKYCMTQTPTRFFPKKKEMILLILNIFISMINTFHVYQ